MTPTTAARRPGRNSLWWSVSPSARAWLTVGFLRGRRPFSALERWQTRYLPAYGVWGLVVVAVFPLVFGFA
ncbi:hypothetical protein [Cryobacterium adonitolivorans]|uniref:hypothetical protein n=1 Tax=Cryobacterium adonitolivorans TaxID=1259189 RepID=UPI00141A724D|nr:hypothetical protein [Cryobacterium adonitolivorans]